MDVSADLVVHYDLLWNPAKEAQREDRCHGIGRGMEGRVTHVVRLIARGTIDEGMRRVTARRSALSADIVDGAAGEAFLKRLSASAIQRLLAGEDIAA
jgi:SNF2 family DNA or RNA helicase